MYVSNEVKEGDQKKPSHPLAFPVFSCNFLSFFCFFCSFSSGPSEGGGRGRGKTPKGEGFFLGLGMNWPPIHTCPR